MESKRSKVVHTCSPGNESRTSVEVEQTVTCVKVCVQAHASIVTESFLMQVSDKIGI